jgi:hypothetical protein
MYYVTIAKQVKLAALAERISTLGKRGAILIAVSFLIKQILADNNYSMGGIITYFSRPGVRHAMAMLLSQCLSPCPPPPDSVV